MVELQRAVDTIEHGRRIVFAMSYDPVEVLEEFARQHGISYPLLSDQGSRTIRRLGLENRAIGIQSSDGDPDQRLVGLPHPGAIHVDDSGRITSKSFDPSHRVRPSASVLLKEELANQPMAVSDSKRANGVEVEFGMISSTYHPQQIQEARIRIAVAEDQHVYVGAVPSGFTPLTIRLGGPVSLATVRPPEFSGHPFRVEGLDIDFEVVDGVIESGTQFRIDDDHGDVSLEAFAEFQTCTLSECFPPTMLRLVLPLASGGVLRE